MNNKRYFSILYYAGKRFKMMTKKNKINDTNEITYYCNLHQTTKNSNTYDKLTIRKKFHFVIVKLYVIKILINII